MIQSARERRRGTEAFLTTLSDAFHLKPEDVSLFKKKKQPASKWNSSPFKRKYFGGSLGLVDNLKIFSIRGNIRITQIDLYVIVFIRNQPEDAELGYKRISFLDS